MIKDYLWVSEKTGNKYWTRDEARKNNDGKVVKYYSIDEKQHTWGQDYFWGIEVIYVDNEQAIISRKTRKEVRETIMRYKKLMNIKSVKLKKYVNERYYKE
jgi:hypothetical protein